MYIFCKSINIYIYNIITCVYVYKYIHTYYVKVQCIRCTRNAPYTLFADPKTPLLVRTVVDVGRAVTKTCW
jgi:hypothetical protein